MAVLRPEGDPVAVRRQLVGERHRRGRPAAVQQGPRRRLPPSASASIGRIGVIPMPPATKTYDARRLQPEVVARTGEVDAPDRAAACRGRTPSRRGRPPRAGRPAGTGTGRRGRRTASTAATARPAGAGRVRPGLPRRQLAAVGVDQLDGEHAGGLVGHRADQERHGRDAPARRSAEAERCPADQNAAFLADGTAGRPALVRSAGWAHAVRHASPPAARPCSSTSAEWCCATRRELVLGRGGREPALAAVRRGGSTSPAPATSCGRRCCATR